ncbi:MAG: hypothetical protein HC896_09785 [Bacteroidales bacterium]|nr:hypothetical protein [Bacteroidales bacterium]
MFWLILLGMVYNGFLQFNWETARYASVLGRIGLGWFFAVLIMLNFNLRGQIIWFICILLGYWAILAFVPYPGHVAGSFTDPDHTIVAYIDQVFLPGRPYFGTYDPEGILSTIPAVATALLGVFCGQWLNVNPAKYSNIKKRFICLQQGWLWYLPATFGQVGCQ